MGWNEKDEGQEMKEFAGYVVCLLFMSANVTVYVVLGMTLYVGAIAVARVI